VLFADFGNLWIDPSNVYDHFSLAASAGTGIRWQTPVGPLALDYGVNLTRLFSAPDDPRRSYDDFGAFHFAIGLF
jgi:outer membrane protein assembly factor BamA